MANDNDENAIEFIYQNYELCPNKIDICIILASRTFENLIYDAERSVAHTKVFCDKVHKVHLYGFTNFCLDLICGYLTSI